MVEAIIAVKEKRMTQRAACKIFKVPRCTLQNRFNWKTQMSTRQGRLTKQIGQPSSPELTEHILSNLERNIEDQSF